MQRLDMTISNEAPKTIEEIGDRTFRVKERMWSWNTVANLQYIWCTDMLMAEGKHKEFKYYYPMAFLEEIKQLEARKEQLIKEKGANLEADLKSLDEKITEFKNKQCSKCIEKVEFRIDRLHDKETGDVLCLASGPSVLDNGKLGADGKTLEFALLPKAEKALKMYRGTIVVADRSLIPCLKAGIIPKYVVVADGVDHVVDYIRDELVEKAIKEHGLIGIFNTQTHPIVTKQWVDYGGKIMWYSVALDALHQTKSLSRYLFHMTNDTVVSVPWGNVGMYCATKNTDVVTKNGMKKITDIIINDEVLTQNGWMPVSNKFSRHYTGKIIKITPSSMNIECGLTPEHKVLTRRFFRKRFGERKNDMKRYELDRFEWKEAGDLRVRKNGDYESDMLVIPRIKQIKQIDSIELDPNKEGLVQSLKLSDSLLELFGWYVSEGWVSDARIGISNTNTEFVTRINDLTRSLGYETRVQKVKRVNTNWKTCYNIWIYSSTLTHVVKDNFNSGVCDKHLPSWVFDLSEQQLIPLLRGLFLGDGTKFDYKGNRIRIGYTSRSKTLIIQLWQLLTRFGLVGSIVHNKAKDAWQLSLPISKGNLEDVSTWKPSDYKQRWRIDDDNVYLPIRKIEQIDYDDKVYDLSSAGSFCAPFVVHNCFGLTYLIGYNPIILYGFDFGFSENDKIEDTPYFNPYYKATCLEFIAKELGVSLEGLTKLDKNNEKFKKACEKYYYDDAHEYKSTSKIHPEVREATIKNHFHFYTNPFGNKVYHDNIFKAYKDIALSFFVANPHAQIINCSDYTSLFAQTCELCKGSKKVNKEVENVKECYKCHVKQVIKSKGELIDCWRCRKFVENHKNGEPIFESTGIQGNNIKCMDLQDYIISKLKV